MSKIVTIAGGLNLNRVYELSSVRGAFPVFYLISQHRMPDTCHLCKFTSELENQFLEETCCSQATLTKAIRHLRKENFIKAVLSSMDGSIWYALNPEFTYSKGDKSTEQKLYDLWKDADYRENAKIWQEIKDRESNKKASTREKLGNTGEKQGKEESNKSYHEEKDTMGEQREIVYHPEEEVIVKKESYNPVTDDPLEQATDYLVKNAGGVNKSKFGTWLYTKGGLMRYLEEKARLHNSGLDKIFPVYVNTDHLDEIVDRFKRNL